MCALSSRVCTLSTWRAARCILRLRPTPMLTCRGSSWAFLEPSRVRFRSCFRAMPTDRSILPPSQTWKSSFETFLPNTQAGELKYAGKTSEAMFRRESAWRTKSGWMSWPSRLPGRNGSEHSTRTCKQNGANHHSRSRLLWALRHLCRGLRGGHAPRSVAAECSAAGILGRPAESAAVTETTTGRT